MDPARASQLCVRWGPDYVSGGRVVYALRVCDCFVHHLQRVDLGNWGRHLRDFQIRHGLGADERNALQLVPQGRMLSATNIVSVICWRRVGNLERSSDLQAPPTATEANV